MAPEGGGSSLVPQEPWLTSGVFRRTLARSCTLTVKHLEVVHQLDVWAVMHNGEAIVTCATEEEAERAAQAIARTQPAGDTAEVTILDDAAANAISDVET